MRLKLFTLPLFITLFTLTITAQQVILTSGGEGSGTGGSASYSAGQVSYTYAASPAGSLSADMQHTYEIVDVSGVTETDDMLISVFPSRVSAFLSLVTETDNSKILEFRLFDLNGRMIRSGKTKDRLTKIFVGDLEPATYHIEIFNGNLKSNSFKFIKN